MRDRPVSHVDLQQIHHDSEVLARCREFGRFRVLPPYRHVSWIIPLVISAVIFFVSIFLPFPFDLAGFVLALAALIGLTTSMLIDDRNSVRRDARSFLAHQIVPCFVCGMDRTWCEPSRPCRGCGVSLDFDSLHAFWEFRTNATLSPKKNDPDVIRAHMEIHTLSWLAAFVPAFVPLMAALGGTLGLPARWSTPSMLILYMLSIAAVSYPIFRLVRLQKSVRRRANGLDILFCPECMHDLRGLPSEGVCPECGRLYSAPRVRAKWWMFDLRWILRHGKRVADG